MLKPNTRIILKIRMYKNVFLNLVPETDLNTRQDEPCQTTLRTRPKEVENNEWRSLEGHNFGNSTRIRSKYSTFLF